MEAAAGVSLDVEYYFPKDPSKILEKLPEVESKKEVPSETSVKKESVMLQPTVSDPKKVTKAVDHALTSRRPKRRYLLPDFRS